MMALTPMEILALILVILIAIKLFVLYVKQRAWLNFTKKLYSNPQTFTIVSLILAIIVGYFVFQELTIVQAFGVMLFLTLLMGIGVAQFKDDMFEFADKIYKRKLLKRARLVTIIWIVLSLWVLWELFLR